MVVYGCFCGTAYEQKLPNKFSSYLAKTDPYCSLSTTGYSLIFSNSSSNPKPLLPNGFENTFSTFC
jgi:hypothetical protein